MYKQKLFIAFILLTFGFFSLPSLASEEKKEAPKGEAVAPATQKTYKERASELANKITKGFYETTWTSYGTSCLEKASKTYAGFASEGEFKEAQTMTELYLFMGEADNLNLDDRDAVYDYLVSKLNTRGGEKIDKAAGVVSTIFGWVKTVGQCVKLAGMQYYKWRLNAALNYAFGKEVTEAEQVSLAEELQKEDSKSVEGGPKNSNN